MHKPYFTHHNCSTTCVFAVITSVCILKRAITHFNNVTIDKMLFKCVAWFLKQHSFSCVVMIIEGRGLTLSQMSEPFEQVGRRGGGHCFKLWISSYLDVWSSLHTCGSHKIYAALTRLNLFHLSDHGGGLWPKQCVQSNKEPLKWQALRAYNLLDDRNTCSVWPRVPWISQIVL